MKMPIAAILIALFAAAQGTENYKARLSLVPMDATMRTNVAGKGSATATLVGNKLSISGSFEGLRSAATIAQLHQGKVMGVRGPVIADLTVAKDLNGQIEGTVSLSSEQVDGLRKGHLYIQIHSEKAPDGNLWGWILR